MSLFKKFAGQTFFYGGTYMMMRILNYFVFSIYLMRKYGENAEFLGLYKLIYGWIGLMIIFLGFRMETTFFRFQKDNPKTFATIFKIFLFCCTVFIGTISVFRKPLAEYIFKKAEMTFDVTGLGGIILILMSIIIALDVLLIVPYANLRREQRPIRFSFYKIIQIGLYFGLFIVALEIFPRLFDMKTWSNLDIIFIILISNIISSAVIFIMFFGSIARNWKGFDRVLPKKLINYSFPLLVGAMSLYLINQGFALVIDFLFPGNDAQVLKDTGLLAGIVQIASLVLIYNQGFNFAAEPFFFEQSDRKDKKIIYANLTKSYCIATSIVIFALMLFGEEIIVVLDENYLKYLYLLPVYLTFNFLYGLYINFSVWFKIEDKTHIATIVSLSAFIIFTTIAIWTAPLVGVAAVAWAGLGAYAVISGLTLILGQRQFPIPYDYSKILFYLILPVVLFYSFQFTTKNWEVSLQMNILIKLLLFVITTLGIWFLERKFIGQIRGMK